MTKLSTTAIVALVMVTNAMLLEEQVNALSITVKSLMKTIQEQNFQIAYLMNELEVKGICVELTLIPNHINRPHSNRWRMHKKPLL